MVLHDTEAFWFYVVGERESMEEIQVKTTAPIPFWSCSIRRWFHVRFLDPKRVETDPFHCIVDSILHVRWKVFLFVRDKETISFHPKQ